MKPTLDRLRPEASNETFTKAQELRSFVFLAVVMAPILAAMIVGGYGFMVWTGS
jgi:nitrate reductase NapE